MDYYLTKTVESSFDDAVEKVTEALKTQGFGVLTEIDLKSTLKNKLDVEFKEYKILGACNPNFAYKALQKEDKIGIMLPCNVTVINQGDGKIEISIVDPKAMMSPVQNADLEPFAEEVKGMLEEVMVKI
jgi:uncharacterized protein (DUF302 family)